VPIGRTSKFVVAALACSIVLQPCVAAPGDAPPVATTNPPPRPKVALVLSGGGARGLAHVGVLKVLREERVPVDFIVATSMGSIVGGAYAAGRTLEELENFVKAADWDLMFSDRPPRKDLSFRRKEDDLRFIGKSELGLTRDGVVLPRGAFGSQNLEEFLRMLARPASDARHLDELPILLRAVATDLETGEQVVLRDVTLSVAMRASMSIPGAFAPTRVEGRLLGDGGLTRNLPVEVARELGADIIIAVNVGTPLAPRAELASALGVAQQMINILTEQNVKISLGMLKPTDILISPELSGVSFVDFERGEDIIARGERAGREAAARLSALALPPREYERWEAIRTRRPVLPDRTIRAVRVEGASRTNPQALMREAADRADIAPGQAGSDEQMIAASRILYGTGEFERVDVRPEFDEGRKTVVIEVDEKPWGPNYLRIGGRAVSDFQTDARFSITLQHTSTWINSWGAEWRNELQFGDVRRLATGFYQPLGPGSPWFVEPILQTVQSDFDIFTTGNQRTDRITNATSSGIMLLGRRLGNTGVGRVAFGREHYRATPVISSRLSGTVKDNGTVARVGVIFDTLDDANFPRSGYIIDANASSVRYSSGDGSAVQTYQIGGLFPVTFGRLTLLGLVGSQRSKDDRGGFGLGGLFNLSGTPVGAVTGTQSAFLGGLAYYRMGDLPRAVGKSWYAGMSLEAGNAWAKRSDMSFGDVRKAASLFLGFDTIIGPLYLGYGHTFKGDSALYLFLGRPTDRN
jgi:NTE family protein